MPTDDVLEQVRQSVSFFGLQMAKEFAVIFVGKLVNITNHLRLRVICHMLSSLDGRIDGAALSEVIAQGEYVGVAIFFSLV